MAMKVQHRACATVRRLAENLVWTFPWVTVAAWQGSELRIMVRHGIAWLSCSQVRETRLQFRYQLY